MKWPVQIRFHESHLWAVYDADGTILKKNFSSQDNALNWLANEGSTHGPIEEAESDGSREREGT